MKIRYKQFNKQFHRKGNRSIFFVLTAKKIKNYFIKKIKFGSAQKNRKIYLKKDIHKKNYKNPYSRQSNGFWGIILRNLNKKRNTISFILLCIITIAWIYVIFFQDTFYIKNIVIKGNKEISVNEITEIAKNFLEKRHLLFIKNSHALFINKSKLKNHLHTKFNLDDLQIESYWSAKSLLIQIREIKPIMIYSVNDKFYSLDKDGKIVKECQLDEVGDESKILFAFDYTSDDLRAGEEIFSNETMATIIYVKNELEKFHNVSIQSLRLKNSPQREIVFKNRIENENKNDNQDYDYNEKINNAVKAMEETDSVEKKINELQAALENIKIERIEEGNIEKQLEHNKIYSPSENYTLLELEIITDDGWVIKLGHDLLNDINVAKKQIDYFATLSNTIDINREVVEYVDLRFSDRIYYR